MRSIGRICARRTKDCWLAISVVFNFRAAFLSRKSSAEHRELSIAALSKVTYSEGDLFGTTVLAKRLFG